VTEGGDWRGKILIDPTNRFGPSASGKSAAEDLATLTGARVVKAFNTIGAEHYLDPKFAGDAATMLVAGDDAEAKRVVSELATQIGFDVVDAGPLAAAVHLENLAGVWVHLAFRTPLGRDIAFRLLRR
jgi:predicted dinucleotide-binding enzyme